ncbi:MAG: hypothetical protein JOY61_01420, partial [Chloroflexi bacterium]|nr:hypothetical protein [Chloroflexota bacterium]
MSRRLLAALTCLLLFVGAVPVSTASAQAAPVAWLRTTRDTPLWSGPTDPAQQFSILPAGSVVEVQYGDVAERRLVFYPGDGQTRQPGPAWISSADVE